MEAVVGGVVFSHPAETTPPMCPGRGTFRPTPCGRDADHEPHQVGMPPRVPPTVVFTRPQDWTQPTRDILWPRLAAERERRHAAKG